MNNDDFKVIINVLDKDTGDVTTSFDRDMPALPDDQTIGRVNMKVHGVSLLIELYRTTQPQAPDHESIALTIGDIIVGFWHDVPTQGEMMDAIEAHLSAVAALSMKYGSIEAEGFDLQAQVAEVDELADDITMYLSTADPRTEEYVEIARSAGKVYAERRILDTLEAMSKAGENATRH